MPYQHCLRAGVKQNYQHAAEKNQYAVIQGSVRASYNLGSLYQGSQEVEQDLGLVIELLTQAAEGGSAVAMQNLGLIYSNPKYRLKGYLNALQSFERATEN
ncbi:hypothetical protein Misp06_01370 [Microbulbifer sp. NBRC 101763]